MKETCINDDWRLRNDLPYKAVKWCTKPTRIKLQNHLSKLNVAHTELFLRRCATGGGKWEASEKEQRYITRLSIINFHYEFCWCEKLMGEPFPALEGRLCKVCLSRFDCFPLPGFSSTTTGKCWTSPSLSIAVRTCFWACNNENNSPRINSL